MTDLKDFLRPTQEQLFEQLCKRFKGKTLVSRGNFVLVKGVAPVMLVAHLDTVHEQPVREICAADNGNILSSPQGIGGDDRCGCYALVKIHELSEKKPWLLFTCEEEVGGIGAQAFSDYYAQERLPVELDSLKCLVDCRCQSVQRLLQSSPARRVHCPLRSRRHDKEGCRYRR